MIDLKIKSIHGIVRAKMKINFTAVLNFNIFKKKPKLRKLDKPFLIT